MFGEHLIDEVLLNLPHRQFVFAFPKALRVFFRHNRTLFSEVSRLIFAIIQNFYNEDFTLDLLSWRHSGFSIDNKVRILNKEAQKSLSQYIALPPLSLKKIYYEPLKGRVLFHATYNEYPFLSHLSSYGWNTAFPTQDQPFLSVSSG